ncbi:DUF1329 domain-containing protein [Solimonas terrae]|uniref:DUF1329 domain-containing protein n=1 Tax=Solimonas terrae TaxID=1396819 RepID=A0A6M2BQF3_9GAMM|nr:DUF1329 domain-containing protein [Solimonas terrae]NGY04852.1 DUF1329 domain-containing protein [Solimonas terrae]
MDLKNAFAFVACGTMLALASTSAMAAVSAAEAATLGGDRLTCNGAEKAGSPAGVAQWTGKFHGTWPGVKEASGYVPGPYANEKPLFTITADNMTQYADKLSEGEQALLKKYPKSYRMNVYPSHRDFDDAPDTCEKARKNAVSAEIVDDGKGLKGIAGAIPFPITKSGLEAIWNVSNAGRVYTEQAICDIADVYAGGAVAWGRQNFRVLVDNNKPDREHTYSEQFTAHFYTGYLLPERDRGFVAVGFQPNNYTSAATQSWQYLPGTRRVRQAPEVGFDYPVPPAGFRTVDDDYGFNGSPERYTWKLVGKKEIYIPYDNFRINDPAVKYSELIKPDTVNPDYLRYELHRVWIIEGTLKQGFRHIYAKRRLYADEDTWLVSLADNYDARGALWRVPLITYHYSQEGHAWHRGVSIYHDLNAGTYEAGYLVNESRKWWQINRPMSPAEFTPDAAARSGH